MATESYESNKFQFPGEFRCSEVALISLSGNIAGIKSSITELNIYEGLTNNFITGDVTFVDTANLLDEMPITGAEYLDFKIRTPIKSMYRDDDDKGGYDFTNRRMAVYKILNKTQLSGGTTQVTLGFISPEAIRNQNVRVSRAFDGSYDKAVADIFKKEYGLNSKRKFYLQETKNNFKFVAPNKRPVDVINMIASRAEPKRSALPGYLFYENGQGFHFRSLDSFFFPVAEGFTPIPEMFEFFCTDEPVQNTMPKNETPLRQLRFAKSYKLSNYVDLIRMQRSGAFASQLISYDAYNKTFSKHNHNYLDDFVRVPHLEKDDDGIDSISYTGLAPNAHYDPTDFSATNSTSFGRTQYNTISDYSQARIMVTSDTANTHNTNMSEGYRTKDTLQRRAMSLELLNTIQLELTTHGNTHLNAGHIIRVNLPRPGQGKTDVKTTQYDKALSGRWLITAVRHKFNFGDTLHQSVYTCIKETYNRQVHRGVSPNKLTVEDEGKPLNLYDRSEYN